MVWYLWVLELSARRESFPNKKRLSQGFWQPTSVGAWSIAAVTRQTSQGSDAHGNCKTIWHSEVQSTKPTSLMLDSPIPIPNSPTHWLLLKQRLKLMPPPTITSLCQLARPKLPNQTSPQARFAERTTGLVPTFDTSQTLRASRKHGHAGDPVSGKDT